MRKSITSIRDPLKRKQKVYNRGVEVVSLIAQRNVEFPLRQIISFGVICLDPLDPEPHSHPEKTPETVAMSPTLAFILALLATHTGVKLNLQIEKDEVRQMQEREEYLHREMTRLLQETEGSSGTMEALLYSAWQQQRLLWVTAAAVALVLLAMGCWLLRRRKHGSASCREAVSKNFNPKEKQGLPSAKELMDELLGVCRELAQRNFMPELHPATRIYTSSEACSLQEKSSTYCQLVILRPPLGHSFHLESTEQPPAKRIRVALECLCSGEQLPGQKCFLHTSGGQLPKHQNGYLLDTLCTGLYLDMEKVTCWVQMVLDSAWQSLPYSCHCQLRRVPSKKSVSFQLHGTSGLHSNIEMIFAKP